MWWKYFMTGFILRLAADRTSSDWRIDRTRADGVGRMLRGPYSSEYWRVRLRALAAL